MNQGKTQVLLQSSCPPILKPCELRTDFLKVCFASSILPFIWLFFQPGVALELYIIFICPALAHVQLQRDRPREAYVRCFAFIIATLVFALSPGPVLTIDVRLVCPNWSRLSGDIRPGLWCAGLVWQWRQRFGLTSRETWMWLYRLLLFGSFLCVRTTFFSGRSEINGRTTVTALCGMQ